MRISVEVTRPLIPLDDSQPNDPKEGEAQVRGDRRALYFLVGSAGDDSHARHGLAWDETADLRIAIYAFSDLNGLTRLAEQVRPAS